MLHSEKRCSGVPIPTYISNATGNEEQAGIANIILMGIVIWLFTSRACDMTLADDSVEKNGDMNIAYSGLFAAALIALILTVVSVLFLGKRGPWGSVWTFFLVLFLTLSTVSIYVAPIGPVYWGIAWIPIVVAGIIITILLIAAMPHTVRDDDEKHEEDVTAKPDFPVTPVGRFFWALVILFVIAIIIGMANPQLAL